MNDEAQSPWDPIASAKAELLERARQRGWGMTEADLFVTHTSDGAVWMYPLAAFDIHPVLLAEHPPISYTDGTITFIVPQFEICLKEGALVARVWGQSYQFLDQFTELMARGDFAAPRPLTNHDSHKEDDHGVVGS